MSETNNATLVAEPKFVATSTDMACAYTNIMVMAVYGIIDGAFKSVKHQIATVERCKQTGEQAETMTSHDAAVFPFIASAALVGFYVLIQYVPRLFNIVLTGYFFLLGTYSVTKRLQPIVHKIFPSKFNSTVYYLSFESKKSCASSRSSPDLSASSAESVSATESDESNSNLEGYNSYIDLDFTNSDIVSFLLSLALGLWYLSTKHWVANNIFGLSFAVTGIELLNLNSFKIGCTLLCGLFIYDVFWVFKTDVMVSVAKNFDAPIKLVFPQDFLVNGFWGKNFAMLGLGDIVIPGIFIAFLLRFDYNRKHKRNIYFWSCMSAYILGLAITIGVMTLFKHAQPALLYLVPCCLITPFVIATCRGQLKELLNYRDHPEEDKIEASTDDQTTSRQQDKEQCGDSQNEEELETKSTTKRSTRSSAKKVK